MDELLSGEVSIAGAMMAVITILALVQLARKVDTHPDEVMVQRAVEEVRRRKRARKRAITLVPVDPTQSQRKKFARLKWDRHRARQCVDADYWGPQPLFDDRQFERVFRVKRSIVEKIIEVAADTTTFFCVCNDATGKASIAPHVKVLMGLKLLAYGVSPSAFLDYFQMGESTARSCMKELAKVISHSETLKESYFRPMNRHDAQQAVILHHEKHRVSGMIGSIDCMHVPWRNCPVAWQGQYKGKGGDATIVMEAYADYNLWFWHVAFGFAGTLNDINIWDQSPLKEAFIDGSFHANVDFEFEIGGTVFRHLYLLADGIYPPLSRFVKTIDEAIGEKNTRYAVWQESSRKDIERAFGVLQRKFHIIVKPVELWHVDDIRDVVECCIMLHNMMVAERIARDEVETEDWYEFKLPTVPTGEEGDPDDEFVQQQHAELDLRRRQELAYYTGPAVNVEAAEEENRRRRQHYSIVQEVINRRWEVLHTKEGHINLREAIMKELAK
jgi:hypothetical protein